jgi:hypothetical protein
MCIKRAPCKHNLSAKRQRGTDSCFFIVQVGNIQAILDQSIPHDRTIHAYQHIQNYSLHVPQIFLMTTTDIVYGTLKALRHVTDWNVMVTIEAVSTKFLNHQMGYQYFATHHAGNHRDCESLRIYLVTGPEGPLSKFLFHREDSVLGIPKVVKACHRLK